MEIFRVTDPEGKDFLVVKLEDGRVFDRQFADIDLFPDQYAIGGAYLLWLMATARHVK